MASQIVYLGAPYAHDDPRVQETRFLLINEAAAHLMRWGFHVFSPISHNHPIQLAGNLPTGWSYWESFDRTMLSVCGAFLMLQLAGWETSVGLAGEIEICRAFRLPVLHTLPDLEALRAVTHELRLVLNRSR